MSNPVELYVDETQINIVSEGSKIDGTIHLDRMSRVHGTLSGQIIGKNGSEIILAESGLIEGDIDADILLIRGFVRGNIRARTRVLIASTGRVIGNIETPNLKVDFGGYFDGKCLMEKLSPHSKITSNPVLSPA